MNKKIKILFIFVILFINKNTVYADRTIDDGTYTIKSILDTNKVIDVSGASTYNKTNIQLYQSNNTKSQIFNIKYNGNDYYTFSSTLNNNKCLNVANNNFSPNTNIELYDCNNSDSQKFIIKKVDNNTYNIITKKNNLYIDVDGAQTKNGTNIKIYTNNNNNAQKFIFTEIIEAKKTISDGTYNIVNAANDMNVIELNNNNISIQQNNNLENQQWKIKYLNNGYYSIVNALNENKCLIENNNLIEIADCNNSDKEMFIIKEKEKNNYNIITKEKELYLTINKRNNNSVELSQKTSDDYQVFKLNKIPTKTIDDGIYIINSALNNNKVIDLAGGNSNNKTNIQLYDSNYTKAQYWNIQYQNNGYYKITSSLNQNKCITVSNENFSINTNIEINECNNLDSQYFIIDKLDNNNYNIITKKNNMNIDVEAAQTKNGTNIKIYQNNGTKAQQFTFTKAKEPKKTIEDGYYIITSKLNQNKVIDISGGSSNNKTNIQLYSINYTKAQIWNVKYQNDGYYIFYSMLNKNKCLTVSNGKFSADSNIELYSCNNTDSQKFIIYEIENGVYNIIAKQKNLHIDVDNAKTSNGTNIKIYTNNNSNAQRFIFKIYENKKIENGTYTIRSTINKNKVIDISGGNSFENANIQIYENNQNINNQKWFINKVNGEYYKIKSGLNSSLYLSPTSQINGANVETSTKESLWELEYIGDNTFNIKLKDTNLYLNINNNNITNESNINITEGNSGNTKKFLFDETEINKDTITINNGNYIIKSKLNSNKVIDVSGATRLNNTNIQLYQQNNTNAQAWKLTYKNNGYYTITSLLNTNTSLDLQGGNTNSGTNIQLYKYNGTDAQLWKLIDDGNGSISIVPKKSNNLCISVKNNKTDNGTNIEAITCNNNNNQKFVLTRNTSTRTYKGMDVSQYQANINWEKVSNSNIDFAIIRLGYGDNWTNQDDKYFEKNVEECEKYNIPYAFYLYSYAKNIDGKTALNANSESAASEAEHALRLLRKIKEKGYNPPIKTSVYIDMEEEKTEYLGKDKLTKISDKFCSILKNNGYNCGIYANKTWLTKFLDAKSLNNKYNIWIAEWTIDSNDFNKALNSKPSYNTTNYKLWQFASEGKVTGISGDVDLNIGYDIFD